MILRSCLLTDTLSQRRNFNTTQMMVYDQITFFTKKLIAFHCFSISYIFGGGAARQGYAGGLWSGWERRVVDGADFPWKSLEILGIPGLGYQHGT